MAGVQVVNGSGQPGSGASIRIRGTGSINGGTAPLYIVDGAPFEGSINAISSYDIASITVLKDAAATAIYGARGANGVVLITTKSGNNNTKFEVNVDAKWGNSQRAVGNYNVMTDPGMYMENAYKALYNSIAYNGGSQAAAFAYADASLYASNGVGYRVFTVPAGERLIGTNFKLNPNATLGYNDG
jgi:TonB-dependent SusC/RagA subfamily outer membrane receptor